MKNSACQCRETIRRKSSDKQVKASEKEREEKATVLWSCSLVLVAAEEKILLTNSQRKYRHKRARTRTQSSLESSVLTSDVNRPTSTNSTAWEARFYSAASDRRTREHPCTSSTGTIRHPSMGPRRQLLEELSLNTWRSSATAAMWTRPDHETMPRSNIALCWPRESSINTWRLLFSGVSTSKNDLFHPLENVNEWKVLGRSFSTVSSGQSTCRRERSRRAKRTTSPRDR